MNDKTDNPCPNNQCQYEYNILMYLQTHAEALARIEEGQKYLVSRVEQINGSIDLLWNKNTVISERVSKLERWRSWITGALAAITGGVALLTAWLTEWRKH